MSLAMDDSNLQTLVDWLGLIEDQHGGGRVRMMAWDKHKGEIEVPPIAGMPVPDLLHELLQIGREAEKYRALVGFCKDVADAVRPGDSSR